MHARSRKGAPLIVTPAALATTPRSVLARSVRSLLAHVQASAVRRRWRRIGRRAVSTSVR
eukprot:4273006-Pleurochrysis_carterae.AAC.3